MGAEVTSTGAKGGATRRLVAGFAPQPFALFFLGIPALVGINQGLLQAGLARYLPQAESIVLWCGNWLLYWWACELLTRTAAGVLRPWQPRPLIVILAGGTLATLLSPVYFAAYALLFVHDMPPDVLAREAAEMAHPLEIHFLARLLASGAGGILLWLLANLFVEHYLRLPRFHALGLGVAPPTANRTNASSPENEAGTPAPAMPAGGEPALAAPRPALLGRLRRLPAPTPDTLLAIEADEHYLKVHSDDGCELIHYRFGDGVRDLAAWDGLQVHRSWWVSRRAVLRLEHDDRRTRLVLRDGTNVPVGTSFLALVRQSGFAVAADAPAPSTAASQGVAARAGSIGTQPSRSARANTH